jgi:hypothetical protein
MGSRQVMVTKRVTAAVSTSDDGDNGEFDIILSTAAQDRHGEIVSSKSWALQPVSVVTPWDG